MDNMKIGNFIREQRTICNLTQKELADKINCTDKAVSRWETGRGIPDVSLLIPLADALDVSVNEILSGEKIAEEEQIERMEETIVNTMSEKKRETGRLNKVIYAFLVFSEIFSIYFFTISATGSDAMGLLVGLLLLTIINSALLGITGIDFKYKCIYPWIVTIAFIPSNYLYWSADEALEVGCLYGMAHLIFSYAVILICAGIVKGISKIVKRK